MKNEEQIYEEISNIFPGIGYHADKPLLYYSRKLAGEAGYEQIALKYDYQAGNIRGNKEKMEQLSMHCMRRRKNSLPRSILHRMQKYCLYRRALARLSHLPMHRSLKKREWQQIFDISYTRRLRQPTPSHRSMRLHYRNG